MTVVEFATLEDFIGELRRESPNIVGKIVRWQQNRTAEQPEAISHSVEVWATAICKAPDHEFLLEMGGACGSDEQDESRGSNNAAIARDKLARECLDLELDLRPGKIEVY